MNVETADEAAPLIRDSDQHRTGSDNLAANTTKTNYYAVEEREEGGSSCSDAHDSEPLIVGDSSDDAKTGSLPWLIAAYCCYTTGQATTLAAVFDVMIALVCRHEYGSELVTLAGPQPNCRDAHIMGIVSTFASYRSIIQASLSVLMTPRLAAYSDRVGRRRIMIYMAFVAAAADLTMALGVRLRADVRLVLVVALLQGLSGYMMTSQVVHAAYVSDTAVPGKRAYALGRLDSALFLCLAVGPLIGSAVLKITNSLAFLYCVSTALYAAYLLIVLVFLDESRTPEARRRSVVAARRASAAADNDASDTQWRRWTATLRAVNILGPLRAAFFSHIGEKRDRTNARLLVAVATCGAELAIGVSPVLLLYSEMKFNWTSVETSYIMSIFGFSRATVLGFIFPLLSKRLHAHVFGWAADGPAPDSPDTPGPRHRNVDRLDVLLIRIGIVFSVVGFAAIGLAPTGALYFAAIVVDSLGGIQLPAVKNAIIKHSEPHAVGELLGAIGLLNSLGQIVGPALFFAIFNLTVASYPATVLFVVAGGYALLFGLTFFLRAVHE